MSYDRVVGWPADIEGACSVDAEHIDLKLGGCPVKAWRTPESPETTVDLYSIKGGLIRSDFEVRLLQILASCVLQWDAADPDK